MLTGGAISKYRKTLYILLLLCPLYSFADNTGPSIEYQALLSQYQSVKPLLETNQYGVPVYIRSDFQKDIATGEVYALISHDFKSVANKLDSSNHWCDVVLLHINVKGCDIEVNNKTRDQLTIYVGRRHYQTPDDAHEMRYRFHKINSTADYLQINLTAKNGPFGTSDYMLMFEVIPYDAVSSFIHFKYSYHYGLMAKFAIDGYLATIGRDKVGFTIKGYNEEHQPIYVQGLQGIVERNSMRYFIAIRSFLDTPALVDEQPDSNPQWETRINQWYELAKGFERQFAEVRDKDYKDTKWKEFRNREATTRTALLRPN